MESIVNYESDDGNLKLTNKSKAKDLPANKRRYSSDDDTSDSSDSSHERSRKHQNEEETKSARRHSPSPSPSPPPRKSSHKSSRGSSHKSHDNRHDRRRRSSSRDSDKYERKKRKDRDDDRDDKKRHRRRSRERDRSVSHDRDGRDSKSRRDRERDRSSERRKDRHDERKRYNRHDDDYRHGKRDEQSYRGDARNSGDNCSGSGSSSSNSSSAIRRAEALNRAIERRANEKVQQLKKMGIEIPAIMQQLKPATDHQASQIRPLMSISTGITGGLMPTNVAPPIVPVATAVATANDETKAEGDNLSLNLSNFTSSVLTNAKYTEQMQKKKLIWGAKKATPEVSTNNKWEAAKFSQDSDGKMASKFLRLMGMKNAPAAAQTAPETDDASVQKREQMFSSMEQQYEIARQVTHTMRGVGLGFGSQSRPC